MRWAPTADQQRLLQYAWTHTQLPSRAQRSGLAEACGVDEKHVRVWFQNRRQRRKQAARMLGCVLHDTDPTLPRTTAHAVLASASDEVARKLLESAVASQVDIDAVAIMRQDASLCLEDAQCLARILLVQRASQRERGGVPQSVEF